MKDRKVFANFLIILFLILSACAKKEILRHPQITPVPEKLTTETLISRIVCTEIKTIKAEMKVSIERSGEYKGTFSGILVYEHPDRLKTQIFGPLGFTFMETLFDKGLLQVFIPPKDTLYSSTVPFDRLLPNSSELMNSKKFIEESEDTYILYILNTEQSDISLRFPQGFENELVIHPHPSLEKGGVGGFDLNLKAKYFFHKIDLSLKTVELYKDRKKQVKIEIYDNEGSIPVNIGIHVGDTFFRLELKDVVINEIFKSNYFKPLKASQTFPLSRFLLDFAPNQ